MTHTHPPNQGTQPRPVRSLFGVSIHRNSIESVGGDPKLHVRFKFTRSIPNCTMLWLGPVFILHRKKVR